MSCTMAELPPVLRLKWLEENLLPLDYTQLDWMVRRISSSSNILTLSLPNRFTRREVNNSNMYWVVPLWQALTLVSSLDFMVTIAATTAMTILQMRILRIDEVKQKGGESEACWDAVPRKPGSKLCEFWFPVLSSSFHSVLMILTFSHSEQRPHLVIECTPTKSPVCFSISMVVSEWSQCLLFPWATWTWSHIVLCRPLLV